VLTLEDASRLQALPLLVGIGLCRALDPYLPSPTPCRLKWPNDLLVEVAGEGRKIGGILIEAVTQAGMPALAIVGFGVNHGHEEGDLPEAGTSLRLLETGVGLEELTWALVQGVEQELACLADMAYAVAAWRERAVHQPGDPLVCRLPDRTVEGTFVAIDDQGRLVLRSGGEEMRISSGEVIG